jgi:hypothetical protein
MEVWGREGLLVLLVLLVRAHQGVWTQQHLLLVVAWGWASTRAQLALGGMHYLPWQEVGAAAVGHHQQQEGIC